MKQSEDFYKMGNYEDKIYSLSETVPGQTQAMSQAVQKTLENNGGVGIMTGYYDHRHRPCHRQYRKHWKIMAG
ncbi:MAG: hypothetical protein KH021_12850 [Ruminococcus sp.]|nr:hypothetical protein [Ruminococcus sp.]